MKKRESVMWSKIRGMLSRLDPVRIENKIGSGTPDVNSVAGWIELKCLPAWPKREDTVVRLPHFTQEQRTWLRRRRLARMKLAGTGKSTCAGEFVLLHVFDCDEWLLFDGLAAAEHLGFMERKNLYTIATARWTQKPTSEQLESALWQR